MLTAALLVMAVPVTELTDPFAHLKTVQTSMSHHELYYIALEDQRDDDETDFCEPNGWRYGGVQPLDGGFGAGYMVIHSARGEDGLCAPLMYALSSAVVGEFESDNLPLRPLLEGHLSFAKLKSKVSELASGPFLVDDVQIAASRLEFNGVSTVTFKGEVCGHSAHVVLDLRTGDVLEEDASERCVENF